MATPELNREALALAHRLAEEGRPLDVCVAIADATVDISRVRRYRYQIIDHALEADRAARPLSLDEDARQAQVIAGLGPELQRLNRYERRAFRSENLLCVRF
jgi:hypothetical protein